ncbi:MAG TPA: hypothetical protein DEQ09_06225 [Bacteroidales bacterium]|nr:hypothetical protein [Bacteroidales bacterium]
MESIIITASGKEDITEAIKDFNSHIDTIKHHFNLFFCKGCLLGPGMDHHSERFRRRNLVRLYTRKRVKTLDHKQWEKDIVKWSKLDYSREFKADDQRIARPDESAINKDIRYNDKMLNVSVFPIRKNRIAGAVIRDMFSPEVQREEVISRINEVIEKNLDMVQKIGFLLGEGASDTEQMLNSILDSYKKSQENKED